MTWIETVEPGEAEGRLAELYGAVATPDGHVDAILKVHSLRPATLEGHLALYKAALHRRPHGLSLRERELVGALVSALNGCEYCVRHHRAALARHVGDAGEASRLLESALADVPEGGTEGGGGEMSDVRARGGEPTLSSRERALCAYAARLTRSPAAMEPAHLEPLRRAGLDDRAILDLNQVVAYFAYANRTVQGLGVRTGDEPLGLHPDAGSASLRHR